MFGASLDQTTALSLGVPPGEWFAAQVRAGRERFCAMHLRARGYEVFLPCYSQSTRWAERVRRVERPLFAGYVFCQINDGVTGKVVTTPGVIRIVGDGCRPLAIPADEIDAIRRIVALNLAAEPCALVHVGQRVRIDAGPLRDIEGIVVTLKNRHRLVVSISLLQRSIAVEVDAAWVSVTRAEHRNRE